ncbi:RDD family protein [Bacillus sp. 179-C3.3 HS]|uniref:RDD family protein n=1 Tax=Bacillus sp. 179-C3.3 HS TaxID=3232162 RepID=UPI0039A04F43
MEPNTLKVNIQEKKHSELAGIDYRFLASLLDGVIVAVPYTIIMLIVAILYFPAVLLEDDTYYSSPPLISQEVVDLFVMLIYFGVLSILIGIVVQWLYYAIMESSKLQGTLGKMAVGIKVTKVTGEKITFAQATGRYFSKIFLSPILYIGYIIAFFTEKKQALHDLIAKTIVVKK